MSTDKFVLLTAVLLLVTTVDRHPGHVDAIPVGDYDDDDGSQWPTAAVLRIRSPCAASGQRLDVDHVILQQQQLNDENSGDAIGCRPCQTRALRTANTMLENLRSQVDHVRKTYAIKRHAVGIGIHADGMPLATQVDMQLNVSDAVSATVSQLSRVAVLLDLVAAEETQQELDPMTETIQRLQDHPQYGIYNVLCRLRGVWTAVTSDERRASAITRLDIEASQLTLATTGRSTHRHMRTYSILHDFELLLDRLFARFNSLVAAAL